MKLLPLSSEGEHLKGWADLTVGKVSGSVFCVRDEEGDSGTVAFAASPFAVMSAMWVLPEISALEPGLYSTFPAGFGSGVSIASIEAIVFADRTDPSAKLLRSVCAEKPEAEVFYPIGNALTWEAATGEQIASTEEYLASAEKKTGS